MSTYITSVLTDPQGLECPICDEVFQKFKSKNVHLRKVHQKKPSYECSPCKFMTRFRSSALRHAKHKHGLELKITCRKCPLQFKREEHFQNHWKSKHDKICDFKCYVSGCAFRASRKSGVDQHYKTYHLKFYKYNCSKCGCYPTNEKTRIRNHKLTCDGTPSYKRWCDKCSTKQRTKFFEKHVLNCKGPKQIKHH